MNIIHTKNGRPVAAFVTEREYGDNIFKIKDQSLIMFLVTSFRIHSWVNVKLGEVQFNTISAMMAGPFESPELPGPPPTPIRNASMIYPDGDQSFLKDIHILGDSENDKIGDPHKKFLRPGLWYSALCGEGTILSYDGNIYIIPDSDIDDLCDQIMSQGPKALAKYPSFEDPTVPYTDDKGLIRESLPGQEPSAKKKAGCFIATACYGSKDVRQVDLLQRYRDEHLCNSVWGRLFISMYYRVSPMLVRYIKRSELLKVTIRKSIIQPIVFFIEKKFTS